MVPKRKQSVLAFLARGRLVPEKYAAEQQAAFDALNDDLDTDQAEPDVREKAKAAAESNKRPVGRNLA